MKYERMKKAVFLSRPNRFIAQADKDGEEVTCHVKNTGRCRELLIPGAAVYIQQVDRPGRKTAYDLIGVQKDGQIINMDSQAPNQVVREMLEEGRLLEDVRLIRPEARCGESRFDFYVETGDGNWYIEVKGVTLKEGKTAKFPDAPTLRGVRHLRELTACRKEGLRAMVCFIIQMKGVSRLIPNKETQEEFARALWEAREAGVDVRAYDCVVGEDFIRADEEIPVVAEGYGLEDIVEPLLHWFAGHARILPWRERPDAYRVWISEIMLQQTRVEAVKPYFERFVGELPDVRALAQAEDDRLMKLWEGLGYYNRARNLKKAAVQVMEQYAGELPADYEALQKLPGIGSYTAGAVASIAYGIPRPAVDGNVLRVISRLFLRDEDILKQSVKKQMEEELAQVMPKDRAGAFNQALMELGAMVCVPNGPAKCEECPLAFLCRARIAGRIGEFPKKAGKKQRKIEEKTIFVIQDGERAVIGKRPPRGLLAGLYELPNAPGHLDMRKAVEYVSSLGFSPIRIQPLPEAKHIFSHVEWHMTGYAVLVEETEISTSQDGEAAVHVGPDGRKLLLVGIRETEEHYPIPTAFKAYTDVLRRKLGADGGIRILSL